MESLEPFIGMPVLLQFKEPFQQSIEGSKVPELPCFLERFGTVVVACVEYFKDPRDNSFNFRDITDPRPKNVRIVRCKIAIPPELVDSVTFVDNPSEELPAES